MKCLPHTVAAVAAPFSDKNVRESELTMFHEHSYNRLDYLPIIALRSQKEISEIQTQTSESDYVTIRKRTYITRYS